MHKSITWQSHDIAYRVEGPAGSPAATAATTPAASPVFLIHGYAEDGEIWNAQIDYLKTRHQLIIPDLPGCGKSSPIKTTISLEECAEIMAVILDAENIATATMIGHSMGGYITLAFAEKHPQRLAAAGLFHSTAYADSEDKKDTRRKCIDFIRKNGAAPFIRQSTPNLFAESTRKQRPELVSGMIERYAGFDPRSLIGYYEAMIARPDRTEILRQFTRPFLFMAGRQDNAVPLAAVLPQTYLPSLSSINILDNAGHMGMLEEPAHSNRILEQFLYQQPIYHE